MSASAQTGRRARRFWTTVRRSSMPWMWSACGWVKATPSRRPVSAARSCARRSGVVSMRARVVPEGGGALEEEGAAAAAVLRVRRVAVAPVAADARDAGGGAAAEDSGGEAGGHGKALGRLDFRGLESGWKVAGIRLAIWLGRVRGWRRQNRRFERRSPACAGSAPDADGLRPCSLVPGGAKVARGGPSPAPLDPPGTAR